MGFVVYVSIEMGYAVYRSTTQYSNSQGRAMRRFLSNVTASLLTVSLLFVLAGCTHTRMLRLSSQHLRDEVNTRAAGRTATLELRNGFDQNVWGIHIAPDITTWLDSEGGQLQSIPTDEVEAVRFKRRGGGALEGYGFGFVLATVGSGIFLTLNNSGNYSLFENLGASAILFGPTGGLLGGFFGRARGRTVYRTQSEQGSNLRSAN